METYLVIIIVIASVIVLYILLGRLFFKLYARNRRDGLPYFKYQKLEDFPGLNEETFSFVNRDNLTLRGSIYFYGNKTNISKYILFIHGNTQGYIQLIHLFNAFAKKGYGIIAYSMEGCGSSDGKRIKNFTRGLYDFIDATKYLSSLTFLKDKHIYLIGHSWGGFVVCNNNISTSLKFEKVVSFSAFNSELRLLNNISKIAYILYPLYKLMYRIKYKDIYKINSLDSLKETNIPTLLIHGTKDKVVNYKKNFLYMKNNLKDKNNVSFLKLNRGHVSFLNDKSSLYMDKCQKKLLIYSYFMFIPFFRNKCKMFAENINYKEVSDLDNILINKTDEFLKQ
jgi:pimeloyl-ACP methyl ester carboxylesterase